MAETYEETVDNEEEHEPSSRELLRFADNLIASRINFTDEVQKIRDMIFLEDTPNLPTLEDMEIARVPLAYEAVRTQVGHLTQNFPRVVVHPLDETNDKDGTVAQKIEDWALALLSRLEELNPFLSEGLWSAGADGIGIWKLSWVPWGDFPLPDSACLDGHVDDDDTHVKLLDEYNRKVSEFVDNAEIPFSIQAIDPLTYHPVRSPFGLEAVVEHGYRDRIWAGRVFGVEFKNNGKVVTTGTRPATGTGSFVGDAVEYHEIWTRKKIYYFISRTLVKTIEHGYPEIPYYEIAGEKTSLMDPDKRTKSFVWPYLRMVPLFDTLLNSIGHHALRESHPSFYEQTAPGSGSMGDDQPDATELSFDSIIHGKPGATMIPLNPPPMSPALIQGMQTISGLMDRTGGNPILGGYGGARTPGVTASTFMEAAKTRLYSTKCSAEMALRRIIRLCLWLTKNKIKEPVRIPSLPDQKTRRRGRIEVTPIIADQFLDIDVFLDITLPQDDYAMHADAVNLKNAKIISHHTAREKVGIKDPVGEGLRIAVEEFLSQPELAQQIAAWAIQARGIGQAQVEGAAAMEIVQRMMGGDIPTPLQGTIEGGGGPAGPGGGGNSGQFMTGNTPANSTYPRTPGMGQSLTPGSPGNPAMQINRPEGRPPDSGFYG